MTGPATPAPEAPGDDAEFVARLRHVEHRYGEVVALDDVTLDIPARRMIGLIGPDGVGKSTLLALTAGVRRLQSGAIETLRGDVADARHRRRILPRIAYMPQGLGQNLYPTLSVRENVSFFSRLFGQDAAERERRISELLQSTGLAPFADRPAGKLSGGMKQKLSLCCSLIHDPELLILDEPTTGVDPLSRRQFWELIDRIRARSPSMSVMTATAYMEEAEGFDQLIAMEGGRVLAAGTAAEIRERAGEDTLEAAFMALSPGGEPKRAAATATAPPPPARADGAAALAIEARGLTKRFGDFTAVERVDLDVRQGEIFGFLGSNGCGKTTTMKMLTGLLSPSAGAARLFGKTVDANDLETRRRVGYMSQAFSLYRELTVRQNLELHARLYGAEPEPRARRVAEMLDRFDLRAVADRLPMTVPLGVRQRLQLAVAVIHEPEMLILDEPTSGVDPVAREGFWDLLLELSRRDGVTIFISTHFLSEAERCDRVSFMHAGRVLAVGAPEELRAARNAETLEASFIAFLEEQEISAGPADETAAPPAIAPASPAPATRWGLDPGRYWAFARRETLEVMRDPIRLAFALLSPIILVLAMAYGISFDIEEVPFAALDQDQTKESRELVETLRGSRYFTERRPVADAAELDERLTNGELKAVLVIPPGFGRDLLAERGPEIAVWLDGANAFRAETARGYVLAAQADYLATLASADAAPAASSGATIALEPRFRYNQAFASVYAITPGAIMMMLIMAPSMLTALGVVREKELGSIANFYAAPASKLEFLIGKQTPYVVIAFISFLTLYAVMRLWLGVPAPGSFAALALGALAFVAAGTAFGLVVSTLVRSQIAAIFATAIIVMIPTVNFSGMLYPTASLEGSAAVIGAGFPSTYFQSISSGVVNKGLGLPELYPNHLALLVFTVVFWAIAALLLAKQER